MELVWLPDAKFSFVKLLTEIRAEFGERTAQKVSEKILSHINLLTSFPNIGVRYTKIPFKEIRYLINTPNLVFYHKTPNAIIILAILDYRQSPSRITKEIKSIISRTI